MTERTPEQMSADAWKAIDALSSTGKCMLPGGKVVLGDDKDAKTLVDLLWKLAMLKGRPTNRSVKAQDWKPQETKA